MNTKATTWTDKRPDSPGWYWFWDGDTKGVVRVEKRMALGRMQCCAKTNNGWALVEEMTCEWAGPIDDPDKQ
jgi:hypothetical protein